MICFAPGLKQKGISFLILLTVFCFFYVASYADKVNTLSEELRELVILRDDFREQVLSLLTLIKELEKNNPPVESPIAKIISPEEPVKEANFIGSATIYTANYNDEFLILEKIDQWYKIQLPDGREGWIDEKTVQVIIREQSRAQEDRKSSDLYHNEILLVQLSILHKDINDQYTSTKDLILKLDYKYNKLTSSQKQGHENIIEEIAVENGKIEKYYSYAKKFIEPYLGFLLDTGTKKEKKRTVPSNKFMGTVSLEFGKTVQNTAEDISGFAGNFDFNGIYKINRNTSITGAIKYQEEVIRTPFASMGITAGIKNTFNKIRLNTNIGYNNYNDKINDVNDFNVVMAGINLFAPLGKKSQLSGHLSRALRTYKLEDGNDFACTRYQINLSLSDNQKHDTNIFIRGNIQNSQLDYLNFTQLNPGIVYTNRGRAGKIFNTLVDFDQFTYTGEAERGNFSRGRLDIKWMRERENKSSTSLLGVIGKIYPNNERQNYLRPNLVFSISKNNLEQGRSKTRTFRITYTYHLLETSSLVDYLDMRFDRLIRGRKGFFNFNMFGRAYNTFDTDVDLYNTLDIFLTFGPTIRSLKSSQNHSYNFRIGPVFGSHLLFGTETDFWDTNGTSFRAGIILQGNINIKKAAMRLMGSYERQFLVTNNYDIDFNTGDLVVGEVMIREPHSIQFDFDFRMPIARAWDIHFNVNYYNIKTDATEETSINPNEQNMRQRIVGGLIYRFVL